MLLFYLSIRNYFIPEFLNIPLTPFNTIYTLNFTIYKWPKHTYTQFLWKSLQFNPWLILITAEALHIITNGSKGFSRQEYRSGQPFPSPGDLPNAGIEPRFPALQADSLPALPDSPGKPKKTGAGSHSFCSGDSPQGSSSWARDQTQVSCIAGSFCPICATREALGWLLAPWKDFKNI